MLYCNIEKRKEILRTFIQNNPKTTDKEIKRKLHTKVKRVYHGGMAEAFKDAGVAPPRTFKRKNKNQRRMIIIDYIRKNQTAGGHTIRRDTKINISSTFNNIQEAYAAASVPYPREEKLKLQKRNESERREEIINSIKKNPNMSVEEIMKKTSVHFYRIFKSTKEAYDLAGVTYIRKSDKIANRKKKMIIDFIKNNPLATEREINRACKTHVQWHFDRGIFEAYEKAEIKFPYERIKLHGAAIKEIKERAMDFEEEIALKLTGYGGVSRLVKTRRGFVDIILERKDKKTVIEVKDYLAHDISASQIKQLNKYLDDCNCNIGFLVCKKKPKKDKFLINGNTLFIITVDELNKIPEVMDKGSVV